jgi:hypothetical protein
MLIGRRLCLEVDMHMKWCALAAGVLLGAGSASAVDYRWTTAMNQGVFQASIENQAKSWVAFSCNSGGLPPIEPSLAVMIRGKAIKGEKLYQFVVDGKNYPAYLTDGWLKGSSMAVMRPMTGIAFALVEARSNAFVVEVPDLKISERFSLLNVRDALDAKSIAACGDR